MAQIHDIRPRRLRPCKGRTHIPKHAPQSGWGVAQILGLAAGGGLLLGAGSVAITPGGAANIMDKLASAAVGVGLARERAPQEGDYWPRCDAARALGTAPIYVGEPGYREGLDGDGDGIACEPYY